MVEALVHGARDRRARRSYALTPREPEILVRDGPWSEQRGDRDSLRLTKRAVEKHINSVFAKLDLPLSETSAVGCARSSCSSRVPTA